MLGFQKSYLRLRWQRARLVQYTGTSGHSAIALKWNEIRDKWISKKSSKSYKHENMQQPKIPEKNKSRPQCKRRWKLQNALSWSSCCRPLEAAPLVLPQTTNTLHLEALFFVSSFLFLSATQCLSALWECNTVQWERNGHWRGQRKK